MQIAFQNNKEEASIVKKRLRCYRISFTPSQNNIRNMATATHLPNSRIVTHLINLTVITNLTLGYHKQNKQPKNIYNPVSR